MDIENCRVKCNVCECEHNAEDCNCCNLGTIEISNEKTSSESINTPHFCKSFCKKN